MPVATDRLTAGENLFPLPSEPCLQRALNSFGVALARSNPSLLVRGGERLGHFSGPFRATPFPLVEDLRTVLAVKGSLRRATRSEEHTSELQSRLHLGCRLLLEKKKKQLTRNHPCQGRTCVCLPDV